MKIMTHAALGTALLIGGGAIAATPNPAAKPIATGDFVTSTGTAAGTVEIVTSASGAPALRVKVMGLPAGLHGIHIHAVGTCDTPAFAAAGGHLNPTGHQHGKDNPAGSHVGDLSNITISEHGSGELAQPLPGDAATLRSQLFDADGAAVVIHAAADDYRTDPSGNSGARIACAVLKAHI